MRKETWIIALICLLLTGCTHQNAWQRQVQSFSSATAPTLDQAAQAYTDVNAGHTLQQEAVILDRYAQDGYKPGELDSFLRNEDIKVRMEAIDALKRYSTLIGDLAAGKRVREFKAAHKAPGSAASGSSSKISGSNAMTAQQLSFITSALDAVVGPLAQYKVMRDLPPLVKKANPAVQSLCSLLEADLGTLSDQAETDYRLRLMEQTKFIADNKDRMSPVELRGEEQKLFTIEDARIREENALTQARQAVLDIAVQHNRIAGGVK